MAYPYDFNQSNIWYQQPGMPMQPGSFGAPPLFGSGPSFTPYRPSFMGQFMDPGMDMMIQQMATMGGQMLGGQGGFASNPFQPSGYTNFGFYAQDARMRQLGMAGAARSHDFSGISGTRGQALYSLLGNLAPDMLPKDITGADFGRWLGGNTAESQALLSGLQAIGISPSMVNPEIGLKMTSARLLSRYTSDPEVLGGFIDAFGAQSGYDPKVGRITDARKSQGWQVDERARFFDTLHAQGLVGIDPSNMTKDKVTQVAASYLKQIGGEGGLDSAFATARALFGTDDPNTIVRSIEAVTGGGIGRMDPHDVNAKLMSLKKLSETAQVSVEALVQFIESSVAIAESHGLSGAAAASLAGGGLATIMGVNNKATSRMAGIITPGLENRNERLLADWGRIQTSALGSPMAMQGANAYVRLITAAGGEDKVAAFVAANDKDGVLQSVLNLKNGKVGLDDIRNVGRSEILASALANATGTSYGENFSYITNKNLGQQALSLFSEFGETTAVANALEKGRRATGAVNNALELKKDTALSEIETVKLLSLTAQYGMTTPEQRNGLASAISEIGGQEGANITRALGGITNGKFDKPFQADRIARFQNTISRAAALVYNDPDRAKYHQEVVAQGRIAADISASIGGLPAIDALLASQKNGQLDIAGALGFRAHNDIIDALVGANKGINAVGKLAGYSAGSLEANTTIDEFARLATGDVDKQVELKKKLNSIIGGAGSAEAKDTAIRDALAATKVAVTPEQKKAAEDQLKELQREAKKPQGERDVMHGLREVLKPGAEFDKCLERNLKGATVKVADIHGRLANHQECIK